MRSSTVSVVDQNVMMCWTV